MTPGYGDSSSGIQEPFNGNSIENKTATNTDATADYHMRIDTRLGYGFTLPSYDGALTPYREATRGASDR